METQIKTDGWTKDAKSYQFYCVECKQYFVADKLYTNCPCCGRKIVKAQLYYNQNTGRAEGIK